ncbi:MAG TPA: twin-arginine translocase TatA/TatE family subunit [Bacteroidota bacterium]|nr:twin-arginine translocase TatA/TatE family subunit [Bacteroidota bacterium]
MFENLGFQEITLIAIVFLIFFGPKKIPELMNGIGRGVREFRRAMNEVKSEISNISTDPYEGPAIHKAAASPHEEPAVAKTAPPDGAHSNDTGVPPPYNNPTIHTAEPTKHENQSSTGE